MVRNSSIPEELGRIRHLLSDKTGTLTQNIMIFKSISSNMGTFTEDSLDDLKQYVIKNIKKSNTTCSDYPIYGNKPDKMSKYRDLMTALMVCNNVTPSMDNGERILQASSPDEIALVKFAESIGYNLLKRTYNSIVIENPLGLTETYEIIENFPFSSERKWMGI